MGGTEFLNLHASSVAKLLDFVIENSNDKGLLSLLPTVDLLIQVLFKRERTSLFGHYSLSVSNDKVAVTLFQFKYPLVLFIDFLS